MATSKQRPPSGGEDATAEITYLRGRVAALEEELAQTHARANAAIAAAEDRAYWLDRWQIDLNEIMARPGMDELRALMRGVRSVYRRMRARFRRLRG